jgi:hypothetical protein
MGVVAFSSFPVEWDSAERVVVRRILYWLPGNKRYRNCTVQSVPWQYLTRCFFPFLAHESRFPGRATLRHLHVGCCCNPDCMVEPRRYVDKGGCNRRSDSACKGLRWLTMRLFGRKPCCASFAPHSLVVRQLKNIEKMYGGIQMKVRESLNQLE